MRPLFLLLDLTDFVANFVSCEGWGEIVCQALDERQEGAGGF